MMQGRWKLLSFVKKKNNLDGNMAMRVAFGICGPGLSFFFSPALMSLCHPWWWMDQIPLLTSLHQFEVYRSLMTAYLRIWHDARRPALLNSGTFHKKFCLVWDDVVWFVILYFPNNVEKTLCFLLLTLSWGFCTIFVTKAELTCLLNGNVMA